MIRHTLAVGLAAFIALSAGRADAQPIRDARENAAGGVTAGGAHDVRGPRGGRAIGEGGVVTNGDGAGFAGSHGCARDAAGGRACRRGATSWDEDGHVVHESGVVFEGPFGATGSSYGSFERETDGDLTGSRSAEIDIGDHTYSAETTFDSSHGLDRNVTCSGDC